MRADDAALIADAVLRGLQDHAIGDRDGANAAPDSTTPETEPRDRFVNATLSGPAILAHAFTPPPSILGGGIMSTGDLGIMFGEAGVSKTYLALQLGLAQSGGEPWFDLETTLEPASVGFVELEIHGHAIQDRLRALGGEIPDRFHLLVRPQLRGAVDLVDAAGKAQDLAELREWIERYQLQVVYIDALARATSCPQADFSRLLLALDVLRSETGCALVLIHHENARDRNGGGGDLDYLRGDSRLRGFPQCIMRVVEHHGVRCVRFPKVNCAAQPEPIYFRPGANGVPERREPPEATSRAKGAKNEAEVYAALCTAYNGQDGVPGRELEKLTGHSPSTVSKHLGALEKSGKVGRDGSARKTTYRPIFRSSEQGKSEDPIPF